MLLQHIKMYLSVVYRLRWYRKAFRR